MRKWSCSWFEQPAATLDSRRGRDSRVLIGSFVLREVGVLACIMHPSCCSADPIEHCNQTRYLTSRLCTNHHLLCPRRLLLTDMVVAVILIHDTTPTACRQPFRETTYLLSEKPAWVFRRGIQGARQVTLHAGMHRDCRRYLPEDVSHFD